MLTILYNPKCLLCYDMYIPQTSLSYPVDSLAMSGSNKIREAVHHSHCQKHADRHDRVGCNTNFGATMIIRLNLVITTLLYSWGKEFV